MSAVIPTLFFPLEREIRPFLRRLHSLKVDALAPEVGRGWMGKTPGGRAIRAFICGVGREGAERVLAQWYAAGGRASVVILAGFAGALVPELAIGAIVRPAEIVDHELGRVWLANGLLRAKGRLATCPTMIGQPAAKAALGTRWQADAVDMEAAAVAAFCAARSIPFGCVRAISDRMQDRLAPVLINLLGRHGRREISVVGLLRGILRRPSLVYDLMRLARDTQLAANQLAEYLIASIDAEL